MMVELMLIARVKDLITKPAVLWHCWLLTCEQKSANFDENQDLIESEVDSPATIFMFFWKQSFIVHCPLLIVLLEKIFLYTGKKNVRFRVEFFLV